MRIALGKPGVAVFSDSQLWLLDRHQIKRVIEQGCEYLEIPDAMQCTESYRDLENFNRRAITISKDGHPVMSINQRIGFEDAGKEDQKPCTSIYLPRAYYSVLPPVRPGGFYPTPFQKALEEKMGEVSRLINASLHARNDGHKTEDQYQSEMREYMKALHQAYSENPTEFDRMFKDAIDLRPFYENFREEIQDPIPAEEEKEEKKPVAEQKSLTAKDSEIQAQMKKRQERKAKMFSDLKSLCYNYALDIYQAAAGKKDKRQAKASINALKRLWARLDEGNILNVESTFNVEGVKNILKRDGDSKAMHFLKSFWRMLKAAITCSISAKKEITKEKYGTTKFWKSEEQLRAKKFIKDLRKIADLQKPVKKP